MSTFPGVFRQYQGISLDNFDHTNLGSTVYWLSHAHSDHMKGLGSSQLLAHLQSSSRIKIYCTDITKKLISCMERYKHLLDYLVPLEIDEPTSVVVPSHAEDYFVMLTAIPAGHCPGSAMLLIEGSGGTVLYTGDFRLEKGSASLMTHLHDSDRQLKDIDAIYCDTTFLTHKAQYIPSRMECEREVLRLVKDHISRGSNYHILLRIKAKLGYENIFRILYDNLAVKTHILPRDKKIYSKISEILETVTDDMNTQVHACCRYIKSEDDDKETITPTCCKCPTLSQSDTVIKIIQLSTLWFVCHEQKCLSIQTGPNTVRCCYSFHSSYSEVEDFIRYLKPNQVSPNVIPVYNTKQQTQSLLDEFINDSPSSPSLQQADSWKSIKEVDLWWVKKRLATPTTDDKVAAKKQKLTPTNTPTKFNDSFCSTHSRESTPEVDLWSDDNNTNISDSVEPDDICGYDSDDDTDEKFNSFYHEGLYSLNDKNNDIQGITTTTTTTIQQTTTTTSTTLIDLTHSNSDSDVTLFEEDVGN